MSTDKKLRRMRKCLIARRATLPHSRRTRPLINLREFLLTPVNSHFPISSPPLSKCFFVWFFGEFNGRGAAVRAEPYAPLKHQSGINGLLPTYGGSPPFIPFV